MSANESNASQSCIICLGILEEADEEKRIEEVTTFVRAQDFEFDSFKVFVKLPVSPQIRMANFLMMFEQEELNRVGTEKEQGAKECAEEGVEGDVSLTDLMKL